MSKWGTLVDARQSMHELLTSPLDIPCWILDIQLYLLTGDLDGEARLLEAVGSISG